MVILSTRLHPKLVEQLDKSPDGVYAITTTVDYRSGLFEKPRIPVV